ncbi:MAG TPA: hypothetical protein ENN56_03125, partial [Firmicutes bacterium]|nr:hypothetical protein [Bacillota bacterium]
MRGVVYCLIGAVAVLSPLSAVADSRGPSVLDGYVGSARHALAVEAGRNSTDVVETPDDLGQSTVRPSSRKSPAKAFILSLLVPGLGEFYAGNMLRGAVFFGIEAASWTAWNVYTKKGDDARADFIAFQTEHWNFERYDTYRRAVWQDLAARSNVFDPSRPLAQRQQDSLTVLIGTHHYDDCCGQATPKTDDQYEMIGKYYRFSYGWDDVTVWDNPDKELRDEVVFSAGSGETWGTNLDAWLSYRGGELVRAEINDSTGVRQVRYLEQVHSANRETYTRMRKDANDYHSTAKTFTTVILFNHIVSAIHAARITSKLNETGVYEPPRTSMRMELYDTGSDYVPMMVLR